MEQGNEVWKVNIKSYAYVHNDHEYCVFATSAGMAEKAALVLAKKEEVEEPYCSSAEFECYVY